MLNGVGETLVEHTGRDDLTQPGEMLQTQIEVVNFRFVEFRIAFQHFKPLEVERAERSFFTEHGTGNGSAVAHSKVGQLDGVKLAKGISEVEAWHQVYFVESALQVGNLFVRQITDQINLPAANEHFSHLKSCTQVSGEALTLAEVEHAVSAPDIQACFVVIDQVREKGRGDIIGLAAGVGHKIAVCEVGFEVPIGFIEEVGRGCLKTKLVFRHRARGAHHAHTSRQTRVLESAQ